MTRTANRPHWTRRDLLRAAGSGIAAAAVGATAAHAAQTEERAELMAIFKAHGVTGSFALHDAAADSLTLVNAERAHTQLVPMSTFKIANSLIALETGVVKDENEIIPYGGKPQPIKAWEKDLPMREAITVSSVPAYQELARRIGLARYRDWLAKLDFGNAETGDDVENFWLNGPLRISAVEQARFLTRLAQAKLPASPRSQAIVRDILRLESRDKATLYGKTGWRFSTPPRIGWWSGWVERDGALHTFALNIDPVAEDDHKKRLPLGKALLAKLDVYA